MSESKQLSIKDIIGKKKEIEAPVSKQLYIPSLGGNITITKPTRKEVLTALDMNDGDGDLYIIYHCVTDPNLKDEELRNAYDIKFEPYKVVEKILDAGEIVEIAQQIIKIAGFNGGVTEIKNS